MKITTMTDTFAPILHILEAKAKDMESAVAAATKVKAWLDACPAADDCPYDETLGAKFEDELKATEKWRAFADKGAEQGAFIRAADFTDEWFNEDDRVFRAYYICMAGGAQWPCGTAILSHVWDRYKQDPLATGQRYYCKVCGTKYQQKWGVICEIGRRDLALYALADMPPQAFQDAKAMAVQRRFGHAKTPQDFVDILPSAHPLDRGLFLKETGEKTGVFRFDVPMFRSLEKFEWNQLFNLVEVDPEATKAAATKVPPAYTQTTIGGSMSSSAMNLPLEEV